MGIDPFTIGYLNYCWQAGLGQYDMSQIDVRPGLLSAFPHAYQLHSDHPQELLWMGPSADCGSNPILG
jgi:hypothetical protein